MGIESNPNMDESHEGDKGCDCVAEMKLVLGEAHEGSDGVGKAHRQEGQKNRKGT
jgi:hypothetical protein